MPTAQRLCTPHLAPLTPCESHSSSHLRLHSKSLSRCKHLVPAGSHGVPPASCRKSRWESHLSAQSLQCRALRPPPPVGGPTEAL